MILIDPSWPEETRLKLIDDHVRDMQELIRCKGWIVLKAYMQQEEDLAFAALQKATTGDMAMKAAGAYTAIRNARNLPESSLNQWVEALRQFPKK